MQTAGRQTLKQIQSLRGIFALLIFLHHFTMRRVALNQTGDLCVAFFLVLSGVVLMLGYGRPGVKPLRYGDFMRRRMLRIYPLYIVTLLISMVVITVNREMGLSPEFWADVFMVQTWIPVRTWYFSGNNPSWFVANYPYFYLVFPLLLCLTRRNFRVFLLLLGCVLAVYFILLPHLPADYAEGIVYIAPYTRVIDFSLGVALGYVIVAKRDDECREVNFVKASLLEGCVTVFLLVAYFTRGAVPVIYQWASWWWLPVATVLYVFTVMPFGEGIVSRILSLKWLVKFGDLSYGYFLSGYFCIDASRKLVMKTLGDWEAHPWLTLAISLILCLLVSIILHRYIEVPISRRLRRHR